MPEERRAGRRRRKRREPRVVGWREWVSLPALGIPRIKAKLDTGARSAAIHAYDLDYFIRDGRRWVRFKVHPLQGDSKTTVSAEAEVVERRTVRSSTGHETQRPVIRTTLQMMGESWPIEITLARRDAMGFRMLLGRSSIRRRLIVDPGQSFLSGKL